MIKKFIYLFLLFSFSMEAQSNYFEKIYGTAGNDFSRSVKQINSGSIYVLGNSDAGTIGSGDISLTKLDKYGNEQWTIYYGTPNSENGFYLNITADGNLVFVAESETSLNNLDVLIYKVDTMGAIIWNKVYATVVNETARYIEQTNDGGYIIAGSQNDFTGAYDMLVLRLDINGDYQWHQTFGRNDNDVASMIHQINTGYILTGDTKSYGAGGYDVMLYSLDTVGNEIWSQTYGDSLQNGCQGILLTSDGNYLSYGETEIFPGSPFDSFLEKIDTNGNVMWYQTYGGGGTDAFFSVNENVDGGFVCTGYSNSYNGGGPLDLFILKTDQGGDFLWKQTYGGAGIDIGYEIIKDIYHNGFIITGKTFRTTEDYYLLKLDINGTLIGISERERQSAQLSDAFPNPSDNFISIGYKINDDPKNCKLILCDIAGKIIDEMQLIGAYGIVKKDVSSLKAGVYFYSFLMNDRIVSTKKIVITSGEQ